MKLIIDIDDNLYTRLFDNGDEYVADMRRACVAIRKGTPLPKVHGRLIDADKLLVHKMYGIFGKAGYKTEAVYVDDINDAPTIIEADKERSE